MELEKNLAEDVASEAQATPVETDEVVQTEAVETAPEASEAPVKDAAEAPDAPAEAPDAPEAAGEAEAPEVSEASEAPAEASEGSEATPEQGTDGETIVATPDVAPARSKIDVARLAKEDLIARAKALADSTDWRRASEEQRALMDEWRQAGYAGKDHNDALWEEFRAARDAFYTRRDAHYADLREQQGQVVETKRAIIEEARAATENVSNWVKTSNLLNDLMERWKAAGNAGRENEQVLWEEFNGIRREFRNRRKADLAERRNKERACADAKRKIVDEARAIADSGNFARENSDRMRQLSDEYKAAGYAGKPANDDLWKEFREAQNAYWTARDQHRRERSERLQEAVERKSGQIEHLKDQNETLTTRLESTLNPEKVAQIKRWIAENEERLGGLKEDIDEIKKKI